MKATIINGTQRKGSTYHFAHMVLDRLAKTMPVEITEFFLPKDLPDFCMGCYGCIFRGENKCPHASKALVLREAMLQADLLILTSPGYVFDVSGQMKAFLDHFGYMWMSHRPEPSMFHKVGLGVVTVAGAGGKTALKTMTRSLRWWGTGRVFGLSQAVMAASFAEVSEKTKAVMAKKAAITAKKMSHLLQGKQPFRPEFVTRFLFGIMKMAKTGHPEWNQIDTDFWKEKGYLDGQFPWLTGKNGL